MACATRVQKHCHLFGTTKAKLYTTACGPGMATLCLRTLLPESTNLKHHTSKTPEHKPTRATPCLGTRLPNRSKEPRQPKCDRATLSQSLPRATLGD